MKIAIIREDGMVVVDGVGRNVDLSAMSNTIHAVHWDSVLGRGEIEYETEDIPVFAQSDDGGQVQIGVRHGRPGNTVLSSFDEFSWVYDAWVAAAKSAPAKTIAELKLDAKRQIDAAAGAARSRYITVVAGQDAVYLIKAQEAQSYKDAGYTGTVPPHIAAEAQETGMSAQAVADMILAIRDQWVSVLSPAIEGKRIGGKAAVDAADDAAAVEAAKVAAIAALDAI